MCHVNRLSADDFTQNTKLYLPRKLNGKISPAGVAIDTFLNVIIFNSRLFVIESCLNLYLEKL